MFGAGWIAGFFAAMLYVMFAQQSYVGQPVDWTGIWWSAGKVFMFFFFVAFFITAPFQRRN